MKDDELAIKILKRISKTAGHEITKTSIYENQSCLRTENMSITVKTIDESSTRFGWNMSFDWYTEEQ